MSTVDLTAILANLAKPADTPPRTPWCRAGCGERLAEQLVDRPENNSGLHACCKEPATAAPQPEQLNITTAASADVEPASTVAELRQVLIDYDASRPRSMQVTLGPSELGTPCQQQIARKLAGAPRRQPDAPTWAPFQGTAVHAEMEKVVAYWNDKLSRARWLAEDHLEVDPGVEGVEPIRGHGDAFDTDLAMVVDWKHVGTTALNKLRAAKRASKPPAEQISPDYRVQAHLYGLGHERKGREVQWVRLVLLARSWQYDDSDEWTERYDRDLAMDAVLRYYATHDLLAALCVAQVPDAIAAVPAAPEPDACKWCVFHRPSQPTNWHGCAGDIARNQRQFDRFTDGLIAP